MTIGASIFCLVAGAILTFAVETDSTEGININNVGVILMIAGVLGLVIYALVWGPRHRRVVGGPTTTIVEERAAPVVERRIYEP